MATGNGGLTQVRSKTEPFIGTSETVLSAIEYLIACTKECGYVEGMYALKNEFEQTFTPKKGMYERIGTQLKNAVLTCNIPAEKGQPVYYSVRYIDMEKGENSIKENYVLNGVVPYAIYEMSLKTLHMLHQDDGESKKHVQDYMNQICSMRLFEKIRERYIKDKDIVFSIMVNPIMMSKLEVMLLQERNLDDVAGCRIQFHPGNKHYYLEGSEEYWKKQWLTSVENFVVESYIKPHSCEEEIFHQVTVSGFQSVATAEKSALGKDNKKRKLETVEEGDSTKKTKSEEEIPVVKTKKEKMNKKQQTN